MSENTIPVEESAEVDAAVDEIAEILGEADEE